jgi:hypothetical protein
MSKERDKGGQMEKTSSSSSKKRSLGRISEMQDGWLLTLTCGVDGRECRVDDVREPISVLPGNGCCRSL